LIPAFQDYAWKNAFEFLSLYFPSVAHHQIRILLNNEVVEFNPESIILREGKRSDHLFLVLTGTLESFQTGSRVRNRLSAGALVGESCFLKDVPADRTYRTASFVRALSIPANQYLEFIKANDLFEELSTSRSLQAVIENTSLFGEGVSSTTQNKIARRMASRRFAVGEIISLIDNTDLFLIASGSFERLLSDNVYETLGPDDFFGEENAVFATPSIFNIRTASNSEVYAISGGLLTDIPIVRWKLFESFERRRSLILNTDISGLPLIHWREEYRISVQAMDTQHKKLFDLAGSVLSTIEGRGGSSEVRAAFNKLFDFAAYHFREEEALMERYGFTDLGSHSRQHAKLLRQGEDMRATFDTSDHATGAEFRDFFGNWMTNHILSEDRKYGPYLNEKGVF
jgi:hemerythrin